MLEIELVSISELDDDDDDEEELPLSIAKAGNATNPNTTAKTNFFNIITPVMLWLIHCFQLFHIVIIVNFTDHEITLYLL